MFFFFFFFNDTATTEIYTLSLHDALPIWASSTSRAPSPLRAALPAPISLPNGDRKSTRLNSSHVRISYAVFCLKKKKKTKRSEHLSSPESFTIVDIKREENIVITALRWLS